MAKPEPRCPSCGRAALRVMYAGIPGRLCSDEACSTAFGGLYLLWSLLPWDGSFLQYDAGKYWPALWAFLRGKVDGE